MTSRTASTYRGPPPRRSGRLPDVDERGRRAAVVGLGAMGAGIAEVFARAGWSVTGIEVDEAAVRRGLSILDRSTKRAVDTGKLTLPERTALLGRISTATDRAPVAEAEIVVEAVVEDLPIKRAVFADLDRLARDA